MLKKNTAVTGFTFGLVSATDGSAITTGTPTGYYTLDGGSQGTITDTPTHEGNGQWSVDLTAGEMNGDVVGLLFTHSGAINASFTIVTTTKLVSDLNDAVTAPTAAQVRTEMDSNSTQLAAILADTGTDIPATLASILTDTGTTLPATLSSILTDTGTTLPAQISALNDISAADILESAMTESYSADGAAPTLAQAMYLVLQYLYERSVSGTTVTVKRLDGSTTAATQTLDDAAAPTSVTRAS